MAMDKEAERLEFDAWAGKAGFSTKRRYWTPEQYDTGEVCDMWRSWQACAEFHRKAEARVVATVEESVVGPTLKIYGIVTQLWFGTSHNAKAYSLAEEINTIARAEQLEQTEEKSNG